jgi:ABC-type glutathione transport system ATPase component
VTDGFHQLAVTGVVKEFGGRRQDRFRAVDDVTLTLDTTKRIGIVGESGSGKSTLSRLMMGLETPTSGSVALDGRELGGLLALTADRVAARRVLQFVGQDTTSSFDPRRTLREAIRDPAMLLRGLSRQAADEAVDELVETLGLAPALVDRKAGDVSGGQRQRCALARALVVRPKLLICDEVVSALDVSVQGSVLNRLKSYCESHGAGLAFVSHGLPATAFVADEMVVMYRGRVVEHGTTEQVVTAPAHEYTARLVAAYRRSARATA